MSSAILFMVCSPTRASRVSRAPTCGGTLLRCPHEFMENYAVEPEFLHTFAFHYKTGEPIPDELIKRIQKSRNFNVAYACMRQVSFGLLDMAYYTQKKPFTQDIIPFEKNAWKDAIITKQLPNTCMTCSSRTSWQAAMQQATIVISGPRCLMQMPSRCSRRRESLTVIRLSVSATASFRKVARSTR